MKNSKLLIVLLSVLLVSLSGCSDQERVIDKIEIVCTEDSKKDRADFTLECIKNANPKSDEEPEDWIYMCERMAKDNFCDEETVTVRQFKPSGGYWRNVEIIKKAH